MPSVSILSLAGEAHLVSPINPSSVFDETDSVVSFNSEEGQQEVSNLSAIEPSTTALTASPPSLALPQLTSSRIENSHHQRSFRNFTRFIRLRQARHMMSTPLDLDMPSGPESSECLIHQANELASTNKWTNNLMSSSSYYFLSFKVISNDGGCHSPAYNSHNLLKNDSSVYCSGRTGTVNIVFQYCGGRVLMDTTCVLDRIVIRSPQQGFTAPCKEGLVFISHKPIHVEKTCQFDQFTKADYDTYLKSIDDLDLSDHNPIAWFNTSNQVQQIIPINQRSGKYVLIKLLRSESEHENIDLEYIGFIGYAGARSFGSPRRLL